MIAILERRKPSVLDLVPAEIRKNLSETLKKRGPKAIECAIEKLLNQNNNGKTKKKSPFDYETLREVYYDNYNMLALIFRSRILC